MAVAQATADATSANQRAAQLTNQRASLAKRYQDELDTIDRLKKQRASWRRDSSIVSRRTLACQYGSREEFAIMLARQSNPIDTSAPDAVSRPLWHATHRSDV